MATTKRKTKPKLTSSPALSAASPQEKNAILDQLLAAHPELLIPTDELACALLMSVDPGDIAAEVTQQLGALGFEELAGRAGRIRGRGYVHETDAAWEVLEETLEPYLADIRRRAKLGFTDAATSLATGTVSGLQRLEGAPDGSLIAFAGDDAVEELVETVISVADAAGIQLLI